MSVIKGFVAILLIETLILYLALSRTPEVTLKATDHVSCDEYGSPDHGPVEVQLQLGTIDRRILIVKTTAVDWSQAEAICTHWNDIGYELEK